MNDKLTCFITGGARGLGYAIKKKFLSHDIQVIAPSREEMELSDISSIQRYLSKLDKKIDILINNAAENTINEIKNINIEDWVRMLQVNLTTAFIITQKIVPQMAKRGFGRIVNIASCYGFRARVGRASYSVTKAGLDALTRATALELAPCGVLVNTVSPGFVNTELTHKNNSLEQIQSLLSRVPLGRLAEPSEIAKVVYFLASSENTYITGQNIMVDGGFTAH